MSGKFKQQPKSLLMIRPAAFDFNPETASSNIFQKQDATLSKRALGEFDRMVDLLRSHEIDVRVFDDTIQPSKPDAIFPNNWISFHEDGRVFIYPMMAENRRMERRADIIEALKEDFQIDDVVDLSADEKIEKYLEGTGSIVFDHPNKIAYACRSPRTSEDVFKKLCEQLGYRKVMFDAVDESGKPIYHTNVMMSVGEKFSVLCLDAIRNDNDQEILLESFASSDHKVIAISYAQMNAFAGNMIEVQAENGEKIVLLSETAFQSLLPGQVNAISQFAEMLPVPVPSIEKIGGGSVRCMVAGIHLKRK